MASEEEKADEAAAKKCGNIHQAARSGDVPALRHFLRVAPEKAHEKDGIGATPLHFAANNGHIAAAELLLSKGAAVDAKSNGGSTPLHLAAQNGRVAAAELLLSKGAAVDAKDNDGEMPLHNAARNGHVAAAELLLSKGAAVDAKNNGGEMPLHNAARNGHVAAAEFLLSKGAAVDAKDNDGKTSLDLAREESETKVEQVLLNPPAKKPSADDGKMPPDLSNKGKAEKEPLPTAADKTSVAGKKDAAPHAAGSGAVAVKNQREASKDEAKKPSAEDGKAPVHRADNASEEVNKAAQELKKAMESGNAQVLKEAIDKAKLHKVSPEEVMEAMDKYIALRESADQAVLSPAQEAARELKKAMEAGNAQALKEAIDKAKLHKVSQEEVMEAMDKYIALRESVKLEPGHGARLAMFSARFNKKNKDTETKFRAVHKILVDNYYEVLMVEAGEGESFGKLTVEYLGRLKRENGIMLAVCTSDYGEMTDSPFCTYYELQTAVEYKIDVLPLQVEDEWQPNPPCGKGHLDKDQSALGYIYQVFKPSRVRLDCRNKPVEEIASKIAAILRKPV